MHLTAAGEHLIVLNTLKAASDLMDRKANISSHRPQNIVVSIMTGDLLITFLNPGDVYFSNFYPVLGNPPTRANKHLVGTACAALRKTASVPAWSRSTTL